MYIYVYRIYTNLYPSPKRFNFARSVVCLHCQFADLPSEAGSDERLLHITPATLTLDFKPHPAVDIDQQIMEVSVPPHRLKAPKSRAS